MALYIMQGEQQLCLVERFHALYPFQSLLKSEKVAITHLFVEIDFKTADHILAVEKVA